MYIMRILMVCWVIFMGVGGVLKKDRKVYKSLMIF